MEQVKIKDNQLKETIMDAYDELATANEMDESNRIYIFWDSEKKKLDYSTYSYAENDNMICLCSFSQFQKVSAHNYDGWHWNEFMQWLRNHKNPQIRALASIQLDHTSVGDEDYDVITEGNYLFELSMWDEEVARDEFIHNILPDLVLDCQKELSKI